MLNARLRGLPDHGFVVVALATVALAVWPGFADPFTSVKWYALEALGVLWIVAEWRRGPVWPPLSRRAAVVLSVLVVLVVAGSLRHGLAWALEPLLARAGFAVVALAAFSYFRRTGLALGPLRAAAAVTCAVVVTLGLLQLAGGRPVSALAAGDGVSATFGNVNMAAQFVALALTIALSGIGEAPGGSRWATASLVALAGGGLAYLYLLGSRSALLALTGALACLLVIDGKRTLVRAAAAVAFLAATLRFLPGAGPPPSAGTAAHKRESVGVRLAVWSDTLRLVRDHPLGVGAGRFEQAFIPYALGGRTRPDESLVFRSPHNEYLRLSAEDGLIASALLAVLLVGLGGALHRSPSVSSWRSPPGRLLASVGVFLAIEAFFQFPFEMAFPSLVAAVTLGLAWACLAPPSAASTAFGSGRVFLAVLVAFVSWALVRVVRAELLWSAGRSDVHAQEEACRLDPRRVEACTQGAWLRIRAGEHEAGRRALVAVLRRAPHYFPAIKLLGEDSMARGDLATGCRTLGLYDALFDGRTALHERLLRECPPGFEDSLRREVTIPFYRVFPLSPADAALFP